MEYKQIPVPVGFEAFIQSIWRLEEDKDCQTTFKSFQLIADSSPGLIFQHSDFGTFFQDGKQLPASFLFGPSTKYSSLQLSGSFKAMGVFFKPDALRTVFGLKAEEFTNSCADLNDIHTCNQNQIVDKLLNSNSSQEQLDLLLSSLSSLQHRNESLLDSNVTFAIAEILASHGRLTLADLSERIKLSERTIERKFKESIGISPKLFSRICQFQSSFKQLKQNNHDRLSDLAYEFDFSDQSHFIRAFKEFSGFTPNNYVRKSRELVDNLALHVE